MARKAARWWPATASIRRAMAIGPGSRATSALRLAPTAGCGFPRRWPTRSPPRSEEHTSELQSLMRISYAVFCLKKKKKNIKKAQDTQKEQANNQSKRDIQ